MGHLADILDIYIDPKKIC